MSSKNPFVQDPELPAVHQTAKGAESLGRKAALYLGIAALGTLAGIALAYLPLLVVAGLLAATLCVSAILLKPFCGLILYVIVFVLRPAEVYPALAALRLEKIVGAITLAALFFEQQRRDGGIHVDNSLQSRLLTAFTLCVLMSVPFALWRSAALDGFMEMLKALALYVMVVQLINTARRLKWFVWTYNLLIIYLAVSSLYSYYSGDFMFAQGIQRAVGTTSAGGNPNFLGTTLASTFPFFFLMSWNRQLGKWRFLMMVFSVILVLTMAITGSRASLLAFLTGLTYMWWISRRRVPMAFVGFTAMVLAFFVLPDQYKDRYATLASSELDASSSLRLNTWITGMHMAFDRPLFGVGISNFIAAHWEYGRRWLDAHSLYVQALAELGFLGATVFFSFLFEVLRLNRRTARALRHVEESWSFERVVLDSAFAGLLALLIGGIFGTSPLRRSWYVFAGLGVVIWRLLASAGSAASRADPPPGAIAAGGATAAGVPPPRRIHGGGPSRRRERLW